MGWVWFTRGFRRLSGFLHLEWYLVLVLVPQMVSTGHYVFLLLLLLLRLVLPRLLVPTT